MGHATLADVVTELQHLRNDVVAGLRRVESILIESLDVQQDMYHAVQNLAEGDQEPYTAAEFAQWRDQFERDVHASPALDLRAKNTLISAASFEKARLYFLSHTGELLSFREWVNIVIRNPNRARHIYGFGDRSIAKLETYYSATE